MSFADPPGRAGDALARLRSRRKPGQGLRLLFVEDDDDSRDLIAGHLRAEGFEVSVAGSVAEGLRALARQRYELVLVDIGLPDGYGWKVAREAKALDPPPRVALVTAWSTAPEQAACGGVDRLVSKPVNPAELTAGLLALAGRSAGKAEP